MNRFTSTIFAFLVACLPVLGFSQSAPTCFTDQVTAEHYLKNPALIDRMQAESDAAYLQYLENKAQQGPESRANCDVYIVPAVFHVIHDGGSSNISDAKVLSQVTATNNHFRRVPGTVGYSEGTDTRIQLATATIDNQGNTFNGITRHFNPALAVHTSTGPNDEYIDLVNLIFWPGYLNVYIVKEVEGSVIGYTFIPDNFGGNSRAIVMSHDFWGTLSPLVGGYTQGKSFTHELGHWLGLRHPFGPGTGGIAEGCNGMDNGNCATLGDRVCDTPQSFEAGFSCNGNVSTCEETPCDRNDWVELYMDYASGNCRDVFSPGQADRMHFFLDGQLSSFVTPANLAATGADPTVMLSEPIADFSASNLMGCVGSTIVFTEETIGCVDSWNWTFPGGSPATSTDENPAVTYNVAGTFPVLLTVSNAQYSTPVTKLSYISIAPTPVSLPYTQSFESSSFPPAGWRVVDYEEDGTWERKLAVASQGAASLTFQAYNSTSCDSDDDLITPMLDLTGKSSANFSFDYAYQYADIDQNEWDELLVEVLDECGAKINNAIFEQIGFFLTTETNPNNSTAYIPSGINSWKTFNGDLKNYLGQKIYLRFRFRSLQGQNFYLDNFQVNGINTALDPLHDLDATSEVVPNPFSQGFQLNMTLPEAENIRLELLDIQGKSLFVRELGLLVAGAHQIDLNEAAITQLSAGVYFLNLQTPTGQVTKKVLKM